MTDKHSTTDRTRQEQAARRRLVADVFGDDLPEQTRDDLTDPGEGSAEGTDAWLRQQVPPHHGA